MALPQKLISCQLPSGTRRSVICQRYMLLQVKKFSCTWLAEAGAAALGVMVLLLLLCATRKCRPQFLQTFWGQSKKVCKRANIQPWEYPPFLKRKFILMYAPESACMENENVKVHCKEFDSELGTSWTSSDGNALGVCLSVQSSHWVVGSQFGFDSTYLQSHDLWSFYSRCGCVMLLSTSTAWVTAELEWMNLTGLRRWDRQNGAI